MNRIFSFDQTAPIASSHRTNSRPRSTRRSRDEVESMLREIAFVLAMTRRVKSEILESREFAETAMA